MLQYLKSFIELNLKAKEKKMKKFQKIKKQITKKIMKK